MTDRMRLLVVTNRFPTGGEEFLRAEIAELANRAAVVIEPAFRPWCHSARTVSKIPSSVAVEVRPLLADMPHVLLAILRAPVRTLVLATRVLRYPHRGVKRVVVLFGVVRGFAVAGRMAGSPPHHIHAYWGTTASTVSMVAAALLRCPWSFTVHRYDVVVDEALPLKSAKASFVRAISATTARLLGDRLANTRSSARAAPVRVLPLPAPPVAPRTVQPSPVSSPVRFVSIGNLVPVKGHAVLIEAVAQLTDVEREGLRLDIIGDGPLRSDLARRIDELGVSGQVRLRGRVANECVLEELVGQVYDCLVLPSVDLGGGLHEGVPYVLMEAMAASVPVVATRAGGVEELVTGDCGLLVPAGDPGVLADALRRICDVDPLERVELGRRGRTRVQSLCAPRAVVDELFGGMSGSGRL